MTQPRPKLIEVALPLAVINAESAREKSIRHGHPSTLHLWWARRPLAAARAVIWASLVDDPSGDPSLSPEEQEHERQRLFGILERLVKELADVAIAELLPRLEGNQMSTILTQRPGVKKPTPAPAPAPAASAEPQS